MKNNSAIKLSIIIPVYNAEKYLKRCIESILTIYSVDFEIILINDGSIDSSDLICKHYSKTDSRIKYFSIINQGPSKARNIGLENAMGEYIQFVDSDDYIENTDFYDLLNKTDYDFIVFGYKIISIKKNISKFKGIPELFISDLGSIRDYFSYLYDKGMFIQLWNKIYKRELIEINKIRFNESYRVSEDFQFNLDYYSKLKNLKTYSYIIYNYNLDNESSIMATYKENYFESRFYLISKFENFINEMQINKTKHINYMLVNITLRGLENIFFKRNDINMAIRRQEIKKIIVDSRVRKNLKYFDLNIKIKFLGLLIKYKCVNLIYLYILVKLFIKRLLYKVYKA